MINNIENLRNRIEQFIEQHPSDNLEKLTELLDRLNVNESNEAGVKERLVEAESLIQEAITNFPIILGNVDKIQFLEELEMELMELHQNLQGRQTEDNSVYGMLE